MVYRKIKKECCGKKLRTFQSDGFLVYKNTRRWIINKKDRRKILESCHSDNLAGHFGRDKTRHKICSRYYWVGLVNDVDEMVMTCDACQKHSNINKKCSQLHPIKVKEEVWSRIGIDLMGPLNETPRGNKYIITCTDYFSKWPEADALKTKSADEVSCFLYKLLTRYGVAEIVMSDQGREFVNDVNRRLFELTGSEHRVSSAYHPQTNGLDERMNQTLT